MMPVTYCWIWYYTVSVKCTPGSLIGRQSKWGLLQLQVKNTIYSCCKKFPNVSLALQNFHLLWKIENMASYLRHHQQNPQGSVCISQSLPKLWMICIWRNDSCCQNLWGLCEVHSLLVETIWRDNIKYVPLVFLSTPSIVSKPGILMLGMSWKCSY